jgi:hypothetical protein
MKYQGKYFFAGVSLISLQVHAPDDEVLFANHKQIADHKRRFDFIVESLRKQGITPEIEECEEGLYLHYFANEVKTPVHRPAIKRNTLGPIISAEEISKRLAKIELDRKNLLRSKLRNNGYHYRPDLEHGRSLVEKRRVAKAIGRWIARDMAIGNSDLKPGQKLFGFERKKMKSDYAALEKILGFKQTRSAYKGKSRYSFYQSIRKNSHVGYERTHFRGYDSQDELATVHNYQEINTLIGLKTFDLELLRLAQEREATKPKPQPKRKAA